MSPRIKKLSNAWKAHQIELDRLEGVMDKIVTKMSRIDDLVCSLPIVSEEDALDRLNFLVAAGRINPPQPKAA